MLFFQIGIVIYILAMLVFQLLNYRGYSEVPAPKTLPKVPPKVSVIVAAHSPIQGLRNILASLGRQDFPDLEIIVTDETPSLETIEVVEKMAHEYGRTRLFRVGTKPPGWSGTTFCLHQGALVASGAWILFLDPSIVLSRTCISTSLAYALEEKIDFLSLMPGYHLQGFWEKLILPICFGWFGTRFSVRKVNSPAHAQAVAVSQFMLIRKDAYQASGGFEKVCGEILEDSALAREFKRLAMSYRLIGGKNLITSRIYGGLGEIWHTWERILVGELGSNFLSIIWTFLMIGVTSILPFASVLFFAGYIGIEHTNPWILFVITLQCVVVLTARVILDWIVGIRPLFSFLHPIGALFVLGILTTSLAKILAGSMEHVEGRVNSEL